MDNKGIDKLFEMLSVKEKGVKTLFSLEGEKFWFKNQKGMVRLRSFAREILNADNEDAIGLIGGRYDSIIEKLLPNVFYQPGEESSEAFSMEGPGYDQMLEHIEKEDPQKALDIHTDFAITVAAVCLGKSMLAAMVPESSTSQTSAATSQESSSETDTEAKSATTSKELAPGFTVGAKKGG